MIFRYNPLTSIADRRFPPGIKIPYRDGQLELLVYSIWNKIQILKSKVSFCSCDMARFFLS